jgi:hypothetical protein
VIDCLFLADFVAEVGEEIAGLPSVQSVCRSLRLERRL